MSAVGGTATDGHVAGHAFEDMPGGTDDEFAALLDRRDIHVVFQPLVDLRTREVVAFEALARGPESSAFASPGALFAAARRTGRVAELDWVCRAAAFTAFLEAELPPSLSLFVNTEPESFASECPADLTDLVAKAETFLRVFVEVNDHALALDPAGVLTAVDRARELGWGIAIDDVGANRVPVAMLPILQADVVKLDLKLLSEARPEDAAATITSVLRHVETTGATLLVEQIESDADARWALALGASYGQGQHLGRPGPLAEAYPSCRRPVSLLKTALADPFITSPFTLVAARGHRPMTRTHADRLSAVIANCPRSTEIWPVFLGSVGSAGHLEDAVVSDSHGRPRRTLLHVVFGVDMSDEPATGVRGVRVHRNDPLADERFLVVLSDQAPVALLARKAPDGLYDVVISHDADDVHRIAHHLIRRVPGPRTENWALPPLTTEHASAAGDSATATNRRRRLRAWRRR